VRFVIQRVNKRVPPARFDKHANIAATFARWQSIIADPGLTRKLASEVIVFEYGMIITGARCSCCSSFGRY
jgi:hypothetical protein